jgi:hypothetical protein
MDLILKKRMPINLVLDVHAVGINVEAVQELGD